MPIMQWLYFDALECLPEAEEVLLTEEECAPVSCVLLFCHTLNVICILHAGLWCTISNCLSFFHRGAVDMMGKLLYLDPSCRIC